MKICNECGKRKEGTTHDQLMATAKLLREATDLLNQGLSVCPSHKISQNIREFLKKCQY